MPRRADRFSIVIVGAGPVGLLLAARLARDPRGAAFDIRIVDAGSPVPWRANEIDARVYALSRESQLLFGERWREVVARRVSPYRCMRVFEGSSPADGFEIRFDAADIAEPDLGHVVEDSLLRAVLLEALAAGGTALAFGNGVDHVERLNGRIDLALGDGTREACDLVVGADGANSSIRAAAGIETMHKDYGQTALVANVASETPHGETAWQRFLPEGPLAFLPLSDGRSSIVWSCAATTATRLLAADDGEFIAALEPASAGILGALGPVGPRYSFPLTFRHARRYARAGIVLVGDAAHVVHPLAGQGMNLGLRDAAVLADTLLAAAAAGEYPADERVLRRYERRQRTHNLTMQLAFDALNGMFGRQFPATLAPLRGLGMRAIDRAGPAKRWLMRRAMGLDSPATRESSMGAHGQ